MESNVVELPVVDKLWAWFETNRKGVVYGATGALFVGLVVYFIVWQQGEKQAAAGNALSDVATSVAEGAAGKADAAQAYLNVASKYPGSMAGARALLQAAGALFADGKYADAQTQFERFGREYQGNPLAGQALLGIASCFDAQGKADQAATAYNDLIRRHPSENFIPQAKFALARLYESQGKAEQARDLYLDVEQSARFNALGSEAGMRVEELIAKNPKLAPQPAVSTNAPAVVSTNAVKK
jgi:predicted negative regulator of RcsB-dependent stress response